MRVAALYRYPVKGFNREKCESLSVLDTRRIAGDRVLGVRFANASALGDAWGTKHEFVALVNTPGIARLHVVFDHKRTLFVYTAIAFLYESSETDEHLVTRMTSRAT